MTHPSTLTHRYSRTEFTKDDDEHLCQYIAEVLPDKGEGGRTGHFIYADLIRRVGISYSKFSNTHPFQADEFGQYKWAHRHPEGGWRERYRKNRDRMDKRIAQIVEESPPPPDGKGRYMYRRNGKIDKDDELNADDDRLDGLDEENSAADNEDSPVQIKSVSVQRQEEEEEDGEGQAVMHQPKARYNLRSRGAQRQEEEIPLGEPPRPKRRKTVSPLSTSRLPSDDTETSFSKRAPQTPLEEPEVPDDLNAILRGFTELDYDKPAEEFVPSPPPSNVAEIGKGEVRARRAVPPLTHRQTRPRSRSPSIQPEAAPATSRTTSRENANVAATALSKPVPESQVFEEFVPDSDDDEGEMHEVEANLQIAPHSQGSSLSHI